MSKENGGPAFPKTGWFSPDGSAAYDSADQDGMTLRDYFAAKAMQAQLTYGKCRDMTPAGIANYAYEFADAMLAERNKNGADKYVEPSDRTAAVERMMHTIKRYDQEARLHCGMLYDALYRKTERTTGAE